MFAHKPLIACFLLGSLPDLALAQAVATQTGNDNEVILEQHGGSNSALLLQQGDANFSRVEQGGGDTSLQPTHLELLQRGMGNQATVYQASDYNFGHSAAVVQLGDENVAEVVQADGNGSRATIHQQGARNIHRVEQLFYANGLESRTFGTNNLTEVTQNGAATATTQQIGSDNRITIDQNVFAYGGGVTVDQDGAFNEAAVTQVGSRYYTGEVNLTQVGSANSVQVVQWAGFSNFSFSQDGIGNELTARQGTRTGTIRGSSAGNDNRVNIDQSFDGPVLDIAQNGSANEIDVVQHAAYGTASISQTGDANVAVLNQLTEFAAPPSAAIIQNGTGNSTSITQR
ncbi:hypothetical protein [Stutzerimonas kunmingensis]|uniref:Curlin associated repeat-containing protein n=1 Tax=Stutzerimonas kunmingensis TaxID=1211807 RepID=A0A9X1N9I8_9GAMM|nr:hypothetical protein [Stutzerimonas kunmingensis]MCD1610426.1 hypothetical protein [Stutzerimonas kunmingensis]PNG02796.1 hypothetical protein CXK98_02220 [Stutzerimonas kunmingensis]